MPYTRAIAHEAGWRWHIPLQHRVGNGLVYCSRHMSDDEATDKLLRDVDGRTLMQPRVIPVPHRPAPEGWNKNVVALGLASGFVEPLESTSIHLVMTGVSRLIHLFPFDGVSQSLVDMYNDDARRRWSTFATSSSCTTTPTSATTAASGANAATWRCPTRWRCAWPCRERAHAWQGDGELFRVDSWTHVMLGQGITPEHFHHLPKAMNDEDLAEFLGRMKAEIARAVARIPRHADFLDRYCKASADVWAALAMPARSPV